MLDPYESGKSYNYNWEYQITAKNVNEKLASYGIGNVLGMKITKFAETGRVTELTVYGTKKNHVFKLEKARTIFSLSSQMYSLSNDAEVILFSFDQKLTNTQLAGKTVITATGKKVISSNDKKITILGDNNSQKSIPALPSIYAFNGKGWGHAVGMSQEGAIGFAKNGYTYSEILEHYFVGTKVEKR